MKGQGSSLLARNGKANMISPLIDVVFNLMITMFIFLMIYMIVVIPDSHESIHFAGNLLPRATAQGDYRAIIPVAGGTGAYTFLFFQESELPNSEPPAGIREISENTILSAPWLTQIPVNNSENIPCDLLHIDDQMYLTLAWDTGIIEGDFYPADTEQIMPFTEQIMPFSVVVFDRKETTRVSPELAEQWGDTYLYFYQEHTGVQSDDALEGETDNSPTTLNEDDNNVTAYVAIRGPFQVIVEPVSIPNSPESLDILSDGNIAATADFTFTENLSPIGGIEPYRFRGRGNIPAWLEIDTASGLLSGTPPAAGTYQFGVELKDDQTHTWDEAIARQGEIREVFVERDITIHVRPNEPLTLQVILPEYGRIGAQVNAAAVANGGIGSYRFSSVNLTPGLELNPENGTITGVPEQTGNYEFIIVVEDESANATEGRVEVTHTWRVIDPLPVPRIVHGGSE